MAENRAGLSPVKLALAEIRELRARLEEYERERAEPVAVVGVAGRFPGAEDVDALWELLCDRRDAIREVPADRWDVDAFFDDDRDTPGKMYTRRGGFLPEVDKFDAHFFGVSPREAASMDPQQRLLLETTWRALEHAAIAPSSLAGTQTGVFVGLSNIDYHLMAFSDRTAVDAYFGSGTSGSVAAGRISYVLGLRGPSLVVDTACSSSLVATHLACQSLRNRECSVALAAGVNLILTPDINIACSKANMMAPDGLCKTFDARADGYVRSEGCAVVVLKRLADAERDGDRILGVIRGSAVNQDGRSSGLTVPNGPSQEAVIRRALENAGVEPHEVAYVEAHGTGTALGDPIEVRALGQVFADRQSRAPLAIGSIKANVGHLEAAAGIAGLVKLLLALQHGSIPGHPHIGGRNPHLDWDALPVTVPVDTQPWPADAERRIAGLSSFGFSGTNAHVIVEAPPTPAPKPEAPDRTRHVLALSARTPEALDRLSDDVAAFLTSTSAPVADVCATANAGRSHAPHRLAVVGATASEMAEALAAARSGAESPRVVRGSVEGAAPDAVFLFTGQGAQYAGMARTLFETHPAFRDTIETCDRLLVSELERPLLSVLFGAKKDTALLEQTAYAQPALFAVGYALAQLWKSWGVVPAAVLGHSVGELAAACVAGVFPLEEGLRLIAARGRLMQALPDSGDMVSVFADEAAVRRVVEPHERSVSIAALNGPEQVVISGRRTAIKTIVAELETQGIKTRNLEASRAFHSPLLDPMLEAFAAEALKIGFAAPRLPIISNLTGERAAAQDISNADYWVRHARQPVRFQQGIETLRRAGHTLFIEIGPAPTLLGIARRFADAPEVRWLPSLRKGRDDWEEILSSLAGVYAAGADVDWAGFERAYPRSRVTVPGHPFQRQRYWLASGGSSVATLQQPAAQMVHPLLGRRIETPLDEVLFDRRLSPADPPYLAEHRVFDSVVFPATGYLEMASAAAKTSGAGTAIVEDLVIAEPLVLPESGDRAVQAVFTPRGDGESAFQVFSRTSAGDTAEWHLHASATVRVQQDGVAQRDELAAVRERCAEHVSSVDHYGLFARSGLDYGPSFRGIADLWRGSSEAAGVIELPPETSAEGYTLHPALLDSCFHVLLAALPGGAAAFTGRHFYLPVSVDRFAVAPAGTDGNAAPVRVWAHARLRPLEGDRPEAFTGDVVVFGETGTTIATIDGLTAKRASAEMLRSVARRSRGDWFYQVQWEAKPAETVPAARTQAAAGTWVIVDDGSAVSAAAAGRLEHGGNRVVTVAETAVGVALDEHLRTRPDDQIAGILYFATGQSAAARGVDATLETVQARVSRTAAAFARISAALSKMKAPADRVLLVTRGATADGELALSGAPLLALAGTLGAEHPDVHCAAIDLDGQAAEGEIERLWHDVTATDRENQIAYRGGRRHVARLRRVTAEAAAARSETNQPVALTITERGMLDNLRLVPLSRRAPGTREVEIEVEASGLNFRDVLNALGMYPGDPGALGNECVGTVVTVGTDVKNVAVGQRVLALVHGGFQTYAIAPADWVTPVPAGLDMHAAATIPMAFTTAEYALKRLAGLKRGERVLIHAATGGVGLAAVQIARRAGAEIFATAGSDEKRAFLKSLGVRHIMNSRTLDFADEIMAQTSGEGVDVVLNSLTGDAIPKSLSVLRKGGRFCEIGKRGIWTPEQVAATRPDVTLFTIFLADVEDSLIQEMLRDLAASFAAGDLQPLTHRVFALSDAASAFRHMAQARHIGKVVLARSLTSAAGEPAAFRGIRADASYLVTGGFGGLGLRIAAALTAAGARHLVLVGRRAPGEAAHAAMAQLEEQGAKIQAVGADVSRDADVARLMAHIAKHMPPLGGVVHAAGVRDDGVLAQLDDGKLTSVLAPKVAGSWNLHRHTLPLGLDFFVLFSSAASVLPSPAQGNYAVANAFLDALAKYRRAQGLPALSINWGPWDDIGMAAGLSERDQKRWERHGVAFIAPDDGVRAFERLIGSPLPQVAVVNADWRRFSDERPGGIPLLADLLDAPAGAAKPAAPARRTSKESRPALLDELERAPKNRARDVVLAHVREHVRQVLALEASFNLEPHQGLRDVGMDSLMALELRNRLQRTTGKPLPATLTFDRPTVAALSAYLADEVLRLEDQAPEPAAAMSPTAPAVVRTGADAIAIVGIGCRFPGSSNDGDAFWQMLRDGVDAIREIPADRWDVDAYYDPNPEAPGKMYTRFGGFLDKVDEFDPHFFGISPRETISLDPQQRLLLEVAWEALEHASQPPDRLLGTKSGVFVGIGTYDYALLHMKQPNPAALDAYFGTGTSLSVAAGRLSYSLGLQGPAMSIDTACSSSLVAVHLACKSLRDRECRLALAGGVNLMLTPEPWVNGCRARMLAPDGRCKTFDASADGYARAEGAGIVVLKRLDDALADGDRVLAVIRGTAVNQDGRSSGLTVPNGPSQQAVIRDALTDAGMEPAAIGYVEAHGTGTALGDPIEIEAIRSVLMPGRPADHPLVVGSVKTNIGHLEAAAGVAGLIKVVMSLQHGEIPPHLHFTTLNPHIEPDGAPVEIATERRPWAAGGRKRVAGVSSFGFSGTNAHVIVEEAPAPAGVADASVTADRPMHVLALSARSEEALRDLASSYARHFAAEGSSLADIAHTASAGRTHFTHRLAVCAASGDEARAALEAFVAGDASAPTRTGNRTAAPEIAFLFTGQGAQYAGMARDLFATHPVFRAALERCDGILRGKLDAPLLDVLYAAAPDTARLNQTAFTQPALFAIEYALAQLWLSWGIKPAALLGHSVGEYVAACLAGVFTLDEGLDLIAARGRLMQALPAGAMAAVFAAEADVAEAIRPFAPALSIAAVNGPEDVVISGAAESVDAVVALVRERGIASQRLTVSHAFHSASMDPILDEFERIAAAVAFKAPALPIVSNLTGEMAGPDIATAAYWRRHLREPVRFAAGVESLIAQGCGLFVEIGPKPTLIGLAKKTLARGSGLGAADVTFLPSLKPPRGEWTQLLDSLASLYAAGAAIDWTAFDAPYVRRKVTAPRYPFQRERYWLDGTGLVRAERADERPHPAAAAPIAAEASADAYRVEWIEVNGAAPARASAGGRTWLVVPDSGKVANQLANVLRERGDRCHVVGDPEELAHALESDGSPAGVLYAAALDAATLPGMTAIDLERAQLEIAGGLLDLVQTLLERRVTVPVHVVTRGVHETGTDGDWHPAVAQAAVWGLARTLAVEHPELWGGLIDIGSDTDAGQIAAALDNADGEDQLALRGGSRYAPRLKRASQADGAFAGCRPDASYLVTGGLGAIGLEIGRWLGVNGAKHIVLVGRTGVPARSEWDALVEGSEAARRVAGIREIERTGATVQVATLDVSEYRDAAAFFASFGTSRPPLRGVVHAAATMGSSRLRGMTPATLAEMLKPKARGAWVLHRLTQDIDLDFFVLFSSISALLGTADLAHYGAANAVLDTLAEYRRSRGLTAVSINWGAWENLRGSEQHKDVFARSGMRSLTVAVALDALGRVLASDATRAVIAAVDWSTFKPVYEARGRRPFLDDMVTSATAGAQASTAPSQQAATLADELAALDPERHREAIVAHVRTSAAAVLGLATRQIDPARGFFDLGMDSLLSVELRRRLEASTGLALPTTLTFKYPTVVAIAEYLAEQIGGRPSSPTEAPVMEETIPDDGDLTEEELAALLASKLSQIR